MRWLDSYRTSVRGSLASERMRSRRAGPLAGRKPSKAKRSLGRPAAESAAIAAQGPGTGDTANPAGSTRGRNAPDAPVLNQLAGGLIAQIDNYGPIYLGGRRTFRAPVNGRLYFGVNDDHLPDNRGEFNVNVNVAGR